MCIRDRKEVARLAGMRQASISEIEQGKRVVNMQEFLTLLALYSTYPYSMQVVKATVLEIFEYVSNNPKFE
jgi:transcriptional regulator with XRE-family HTH domain